MHGIAGRCIVLTAAVGVTLSAQGITPDSPDFFETKVRPVLATSCFGCHTESAMGGLRLDSAEGLAKGGKRGSAIVAGSPDKSLLITAIRHTDANLKMPMGNKLKDAEIAALEAWVKAGAKWPAKVATAPKTVDGKYVIRPEARAFWSFQPLQSPAAPAVKDTKWARTAIDKFILAKLEKEGIKPAKQASKRDLIRRASLDLTGLPATFEEIDAFEKDSSPDAFAKVVDRLMASPHYGERWGRAWLDVARFGEDDYRSLNPFPRGYRPYPNAFSYRDWVINAMNDDLPYDQFVKAQLAGDLLDAKERHKNLPATGFLGLGPWYYDNGAFEITRADERHDRVDVITRGFMGLTVACSRCHDHKYDPIPQTDYYALASVFYNTIYEEYPMAPKSVVAEYQKLEEDMDREQKILQEANQSLSNDLSRALAFQASNYLQGVWEITGPQKKKIEQVVETRKLDYELMDRWVKYMGKTTTKYKNKAAWQAMIKKPASTMPEAKKLADKFQEEIIAVMLERNELDAENKVIVAKDLEGTKPKKRTDKPSNFTSFKDFNPGSWLRLKSLPEEDNNFWTEIFQRELPEADDPNAMMAMGNRQGTPGVLLFRGWGLESRVGSEAQTRLKSMQSGVDALKKKLETKFPFIHGVRDAETLSEIKLHFRGDPANLVGPDIPRHFLSVLSSGEPTPFKQGSGRLELAEAIMKQPVTTRVIVNRIWKGHFGTGIVDTPSNFGMSGERPTNPELLEYLATTFTKNGMSMKKLHREIMLSSVYQLSGDNDAAAFAKDSGNRFYWRANRKRMDAEQVRDSIMYVSGNLDTAVGGPSADLTPTMLRRTVYGKVSRYKLDEYLQLFDFPSPLISAEKRFITTVPSQRLFLMNSDFMQVEAEELAKKVAGEANNRERIRKAYKLVYGRDASEEEVALGVEYLKMEPLLEYEERKKKTPERGPGGGRRGRPGAGAPAAEGEKVISSNAAPGGTPKAPEGAMKGDVAAKPEAPEMPMPADMPAAEGAPAAGGGAMGMGMMGGMGGMGMGGPGGRRGAPGAAPEVKYEATAWGRYAKVLLSSSEFLFIN
ncbi:MAG TPA: PSD1 and planctomycete cytochrome C domain-containing protein [Bryobacteraceae bacterium]|nr:PSD1 and planctomycete cytochrome C domain-containing protein [Bryobacteraceae bacterium]